MYVCFALDARQPAPCRKTGVFSADFREGCGFTAHRKVGCSRRHCNWRYSRTLAYTGMGGHRVLYDDCKNHGVGIGGQRLAAWHIHRIAASNVLSARRANARMSGDTSLPGLIAVIASGWVTPRDGRDSWARPVYHAYRTSSGQAIRFDLASVPRHWL
jgi:hypothetical protein